MSKGFRQAKSEAESLLRIVTIGSSPCMGTAYEKHMLSDIIKYALNSVNNIDQFIV